jgi:AraC-like DNA-binding protein
MECVWYSRSDYGGSFISIANNLSELVITRCRGKTTLTVRGPETYATPAHCPPDAEFIGIVFKPGVFMPDFPAKMVMDRRDVNLPQASGKSFWLNGAAWQYPTFDNAEVFVNWLVQDNLLVRDTLVTDVLHGQPLTLSLRTIQRRFLQATGMTHGTYLQIQRARHALALLKQGISILDAVYLAGYADQPHMTRALKHLVGQTPAQLANTTEREPLSLLFKTETL